MIDIHTLLTSADILTINDITSTADNSEFGTTHMKLTLNLNSSLNNLLLTSEMAFCRNPAGCRT
jgi:hypothetical protein